MKASKKSKKTNDSHIEAIDRMSHAEYAIHQRSRQADLDSKVVQVMRYMQDRPQTCLFSRSLLDSRFEKIKTVDHVLHDGKVSVLRPLTTKYVEKSTRKADCLISCTRSSIGHRHAIAKFSKVADI